MYIFVSIFLKNFKNGILNRLRQKMIFFGKYANLYIGFKYSFFIMRRCYKNG